MCSGWWGKLLSNRTLGMRLQINEREREEQEQERNTRRVQIASYLPPSFSSSCYFGVSARATNRKQSNTFFIFMQMS